MPFQGFFDLLGRERRPFALVEQPAVEGVEDRGRVVRVGPVGRQVVAPQVVDDVAGVVDAVPRVERGLGGDRSNAELSARPKSLMIGLALVAGLSVVGSSMVASATDEIDSSLGADYIIQTSNFMPILPEAAEAA
ncbi:hypothetical protein RM590_35150, partial [Streptomyces sp. DSM 44938]|nr:hypothetical protein [Streptomyces sp. DSM 44938]